MTTASMPRLGWVGIGVVLCVIASGAAAPRPQTGVVWMVFVDDFHSDFRNTGRLRNLLKSIATELIQEGDSFGLRSSGPSRLDAAITSDRSKLTTGIGRVSGNALKTGDILRSPRDGILANEVLSRSSLALDAARRALDSLIDHANDDAPPAAKALVYVGNGYYFDALPLSAGLSIATNPLGPGREISAAVLSHARSELATVAARAGVRIVVIDPRAAIPSTIEWDLDPDVSRTYRTATQESLRPLWEQTDGFALLTHEDLFSGLARISTAMRR